MGTRHLIMVKLRGEIRVAQYGQWSGEPTGQGKIIAAFVQKNLLSAMGTFRQFVEKLDALEWATEEDRRAAWRKVGSPDGDSLTFSQGEKLERTNPAFTRDTGAKILTAIMNGKATKLEDERKCEDVAWRYLVDLDTRAVSVFSTAGRKPDKVVPFIHFTVASMAALEAECEKRCDQRIGRMVATEQRKRAQREATEIARLEAESAENGVVGKKYKGFPLYKTRFGWQCNGIRMDKLPDVKLILNIMLDKGVIRDVAIMEFWAIRRAEQDKRELAKLERKRLRMQAKHSRAELARRPTF